MKLELNTQEERALAALLHLSQEDSSLPDDMKLQLSHIHEQLGKRLNPIREAPYILTRDGLRKELDGRLTPEVISYLFH
jgi:hypothetical protein